MAAGLLHEAIDHAESEPGAVALRLRREERLEDLVDNVGRNSATGVGHRDHDVLARGHLGVAFGVVIVEEGISGLDGELALTIHRVARVDRQVEQRILDLHRVDERVPKSAGDHRLDFDALAKRAPQHVVDAADQAAEIDHFRRERLTPRRRPGAATPVSIRARSLRSRFAAAVRREGCRRRRGSEAGGCRR